MSLKIVVASTNPVKVAAVSQGFRRLFPTQPFITEPFQAPSNVSQQPMSRAETYQGAYNRARAAMAARPDAAYAVGIEGGVELDEQGQMSVFAWVVVSDNGGRLGKAQTAVFFLPEEVTQLVLSGYELGHADDIVFGRDNSKQANGSIGLLTNDVITRTDYYIPAVIMAFIPFKNPSLTWLF